MVVIALAGPKGRIRLAVRFDLPEPSDHQIAELIAQHAAAVITRNQLGHAVAIGYGPGELVTPVADRIRQALPAAGIQLQDIIRVEDGRYWSYTCANPACCPADGHPVTIPGTHPAATAMVYAGLPAAPSRAALAATIAPLTGAAADEMRRATARAERALRPDAISGPAAPVADGLAAVQRAIRLYRDGGSLTAPAEFARLAIALISLRIRDDAWARMDPQHRAAHARLWTDLTRRTCPGYVAAPASLLAFTAWQAGHGALANLAIDRALTDDPAYSMALLLSDALAAGMPPSAARLPMTPDEVAASYDRRHDHI